MTYGNTSTNISLAISAYDIMKAKKNSKDGVKHFTETSENPMQTQSKNIETCIDEKNNLAYTKDDGKGFLDLQTFVSYHIPYRAPKKVRISKYGIGGCIFTTLSDQRVVLSRSYNKETDEILEFASFWDTSTRESCDAPQIFYKENNVWYSVDIDNGTLKISSIETMRKIAADFSFSHILEDFLSSMERETIVLLPNVRSQEIKQNYFGFSGLAEVVKSEFFEKYHLLIETTGLNMTVKYINGIGEINQSKIQGYDPRSQIDRKTTREVSEKNADGAQIFSWVSNSSDSPLNERGVHVYRELIKIITLPFMRRHKRNLEKIINIDASKSSVRFNLERQIILYDSDSDDFVKIGETKDEISLSYNIKKATADQFTKITKFVSDKRKSTTKNDLNKTAKTVSIDTIEVDKETSFLIKDGKATIAENSNLHKHLSNWPDKSARDCITAFMEAFQDTIFLHGETLGQKGEATRLLNKVGILLETKLSEIKI